MPATLTSRAQSVWQSRSLDVSGYVLCVFCAGICTSMHACTHVRSICVYHLIFAELYFHSFSGSAAICESLKLCCAAIADVLDPFRSPPFSCVCMRVLVCVCVCVCVCVMCVCLCVCVCFLCIMRVSFASCSRSRHCFEG